MTTHCGCDAPVRAYGLCESCYKKERKRAIADGTWHVERHDPATAIAHIKKLNEQGATLRGIARASGLARSCIWDIQSKEKVYVEPRTEAKLLRVTLEQAIANSAGVVKAHGAQRRLQALNAMGWEHRRLAQMIGAPVQVVSRIISGAQAGVSAERWLAIAELYRKLEMKPGPSRRSQLIAKGKGYAVPLLWNEGQIDDPKAKPSAYAWDRYQGGHKVVA